MHSAWLVHGETPGGFRSKLASFPGLRRHLGTRLGASAMLVSQCAQSCCGIGNE